MYTPYGPHKIGPTLQIGLPKELAERQRLTPGDRVYFIADPDEVGVIHLVPEELVATWLSEGRARRRNQIRSDRGDN